MKVRDEPHLVFASKTASYVEICEPRYSKNGQYAIVQVSRRLNYTGKGDQMKDNKSAYNSSIYDEHITNVLPYYVEYHNQALDVVRAMDIKSPSWLDTGCGTGTLARRILEKYPDAKLTLCDPSSKMLDIAKTKLSGNDIRYFNLSSEDLQFKNEFDVITQCATPIIIVPL